LKPYLIFRAHGSEKYGKLVQQNIDQINYFADLVRKEPSIEICAPVESNVICFRYRGIQMLSEDQIEQLNKAILQELWKFSFGVVSDTRIKGRYVLRAANVNYRSHREDFAWLLEEVTKLGEKLLPEIVSKK
jgi:glutamate/tyrosine decarboxylase-like PLP-dependent enzyme